MAAVAVAVDVVVYPALFFQNGWSRFVGRAQHKQVLRLLGQVEPLGLGIVVDLVFVAHALLELAALEGGRHVGRNQQVLHLKMPALAFL